MNDGIIRLAFRNVGKHLYFWRCPHCSEEGTIQTTPHTVTATVKEIHALRSPSCRWDEDAVVVRRHRSHAA